MWTSLALQIPDGLAYSGFTLLAGALVALAAWALSRITSHEARLSVLEALVGIRKPKSKSKEDES